MLPVTLKILLFLTQISRLLFLTQISASRLQPLDAGITRNFKVKYRKRLLKKRLKILKESSPLLMPYK